MAIRPDWNIGKINLVAGSDEFTTVNAMLNMSAVEPGDVIITPSGHILVIKVITGANSGTLMLPCPASAAGTELPLRIRFQPDGSRLAGALRSASALLSGGNVEAFAKLVGVVGGVPVFTGLGTLELVDKSEFATPDPNGNLAELASIAKQNDQFIVMGDDGSIQLMAISDITDSIATNATAIATNATAIDNLNQNKFDNPSGTIAEYIRGDGSKAPLNKAAVGLGNVANIAPADLPISTPTQDALNAKLDLTGGTMSGDLLFVKSTPAIYYVTPNNNIGYRTMANIANGIDYGWHVGAGYSGGEILVVKSNSTVSINGTLSKAGGTFDIDHPLDPFNKNLRHGFVESTEYMNLYRGIVTLEDGRMSVDIDAAFGMSDGTFAALNADVMVTSLQNQNSFDRVCVEGDVSSGKFTIICENESSTADIAWLVSGRRKDAYVINIDENCERGTGRFIPEYEKEEAI